MHSVKGGEAQPTLGDAEPPQELYDKEAVRRGFGTKTTEEVSLCRICAFRLKTSTGTNMVRALVQLYEEIRRLRLSNLQLESERTELKIKCGILDTKLQHMNTLYMGTKSEVVRMKAEAAVRKVKPFVGSGEKLLVALLALLALRALRALAEELQQGGTSPLRASTLAGMHASSGQETLEAAEAQQGPASFPPLSNGVEAARVSTDAVSVAGGSSPGATKSALESALKEAMALRSRIGRSGKSPGEGYIGLGS
eukprot:scaffold7673_cov258-Pinguiococcus_pyrenoidosus.AAC.8